MKIKSNSILNFVLCISLFCMLSITSKAQLPSKPNIIMVLIDDQDMDEISTYGGKVYTPNMDKLAAEGIKFNRAFVSSTVCTPSRYSFFTGRYAGNSRSIIYKQQVGKTKQGFPGFNVALENDKMNVAHVLSKNGYVTGFTGKYHLGSEFDQPEMFVNGHKRVVGSETNAFKNSKPSPEATKAFAQKEAWSCNYLKYIGFDWAKNVYEGNVDKPYSTHNPEWTTSAALEFIEENKDKPFFLQVCPTLLHGPDNQWVKSFDKPDYTGAGEVKAHPSVMKKRKALRKKLVELGYDPKSGAWGCAWIDAMLGEILNKLDDLNIDENTLLIFAPDHGSDDKASLFSINGAQIPLLMRWPKGISAGIESNLLVQNIDLAPTYFELAGSIVPENYQIDGRSLVPLLKNGNTTKWRDNLYLELGNARAVVSNDWKYIATRYSKEHIQEIKTSDPHNLPKLMSPLNRSGIGVRGASHPGFWDEDQLYNLNQDPNEMKNLAYDANSIEVVSKMKDLLNEHIKNISRPFGEFYHTENASLPGQVKNEIELVKQIKVKGKTVTVPDHILKNWKKPASQ